MDEKTRTDKLSATLCTRGSKSLDDCIAFILNQVRTGGCCGTTDDEVWSLVVYHYDGDNIDVGNPTSYGVMVSHEMELTKEEKVQTREDALEVYREEGIRKIQQRRSRSKPATKAAQSSQTELSLFDF